MATNTKTQAVSATAKASAPSVQHKPDMKSSTAAKTSSPADTKAFNQSAQNASSPKASIGTKNATTPAPATTNTPGGNSGGGTAPGNGAAPGAGQVQNAVADGKPTTVALASYDSSTATGNAASVPSNVAAGVQGNLPAGAPASLPAKNPSGGIQLAPQDKVDQALTTRAQKGQGAIPGLETATLARAGGDSIFNNVREQNENKPGSEAAALAAVGNNGQFSDPSRIGAGDVIFAGMAAPGGVSAGTVTAINNANTVSNNAVSQEAKDAEGKSFLGDLQTMAQTSQYNDANSLKTQAQTMRDSLIGDRYAYSSADRDTLKQQTQDALTAFENGLGPDNAESGAARPQGSGGTQAAPGAAPAASAAGTPGLGPHDNTADPSNTPPGAAAAPGAPAAGTPGFGPHDNTADPSNTPPGAQTNPAAAPNPVNAAYNQVTAASTQTPGGQLQTDVHDTGVSAQNASQAMLDGLNGLKDPAQKAQLAQDLTTVKGSPVSGNQPANGQSTALDNVTAQIGYTVGNARGNLTSPLTADGWKDQPDQTRADTAVVNLANAAAQSPQLADAAGMSLAKATPMTQDDRNYLKDGGFAQALDVDKSLADNRVANGNGALRDSYVKSLKQLGDQAAPDGGKSSTPEQKSLAADYYTAAQNASEVNLGAPAPESVNDTQQQDQYGLHASGTAQVSGTPSKPTSGSSPNGLDDTQQRDQYSQKASAVPSPSVVQTPSVAPPIIPQGGDTTLTPITSSTEGRSVGGGHFVN